MADQQGLKENQQADDAAPQRGATADLAPGFHSWILGQVNDAVVAIDNDGRVTYLNHAAERQYRVTAAEAVGRPLPQLYEFHWIHPGDEGRAFESLAQRGFWRGENLHVLPDGTTLRVESAVSVLTGSGGARAGLLAVIRDISAAREAEEALRGSDARQAFLLRLDDRLRPLSDPEEIQFEAACALGEYLGASRVGYAEDAGDGESVCVTRNYVDRVGSIEGRHRYADYDAALLSSLRSGRTVVRNDASDPDLSEAERATHAAVQIGATVNVPLVKGGRLLAVLFVHRREAHEWSANEIAMIQAVAERTWDAVERARAETALRESEARYRTLFQSIDEGFCILQVIFDEAGRPVDYRYLEINDVFERQSGMTGVLGRTMREIVPDIEPFWFEIYGRVAMTGEPNRFTAQAKAMGRWFDVYAFRAGEPGQRQVAVLFKDITERKQAAEALQELEARQRIALDAAALGTWKHDIVSGTLEQDERASLHNGVEAGVTRIGELLARIHPDDQAGLKQIMAAALSPETKAPVASEHRVVHRNGEIRWLAINGHVHFETIDGVERPITAIGTTRDVTDQKSVEVTLRDADRRKDEFLAILAHELRNPLAPIRTAVAILRAPGVPERVATRSRDIIERQATQMARLVDDLLDVSRLSRGKMSLKRDRVRLDDVLDAAVETARPLIEEHGHRLSDHRSLHPIVLDADQARLSQVFANVLNNAAKYTPAGGAIAIEVTDRQDRVEIRITDTGRGIASDQLERIFDLFAQGTGDSTVGGLGIGLALARRLVELHGGQLTATSAGPGKGATFAIRLPTIASAEQRDPRTVSEPPPASSCRGHRVLIVDDNVDAADTAAMLLQSNGCAVRTAYGGEQALKALAAFAPDVVLLDIGMPGMDGLETCRRIRSGPGGSSIYIVAVTGWGQEESRRQTQLAGFDAHLVKPVAPEALLQLLEGLPSR